MNEERIKEIVEQVILERLGDYSKIPLSVQKAFELRLTANNISSSSKTVASETQAVNEAGASSYNVPALHDGFVQTIVNGVTIYIPYYT